MRVVQSALRHPALNDGHESQPDEHRRGHIHQDGQKDPALFEHIFLGVCEMLFSEDVEVNVTGKTNKNRAVVDLVG